MKKVLAVNKLHPKHCAYLSAPVRGVMFSEYSSSVLGGAWQTTANDIGQASTKHTSS